jgi:hypothetical protein
MVSASWLRAAPGYFQILVNGAAGGVPGDQRGFAKRERLLWRQFSSFQIILRRHAKRIGDAIEEGEHRGNVHRFGNLIFSPSEIPQALNIFVSRTICGVGDQLDVIEQAALRAGQSCSF